MQFAAIPGLEDVKSHLLSAIKKRKVAHAQLFFSNNGGANLAMALAYATYLNCEDKHDQDACGKCSACSKSSKLVHPDLHFVFPVAISKRVAKDPSCAVYMKEWRQFVLSNPYQSITDWGQAMGIENRQPSISAEEARGIIKKISLKAYEGEYKVLIIWLPEFMNLTSGNAILKILEEPPPKTVFLLVANNHDKLLTTILSRTQKVMIRGFGEAEIQSFIEKQYDCPPERASKISFIADGDMTEAIRLMSEEEENHHELFRTWLRKCFTFKIGELSDMGENFQKLGREGQKTLMHYGLGIIRECLLMGYAPQLCKLRDSEKEFVEKFAKATNGDILERISQHLNTAYFHIERNANPRILFMDMSLQIALVLKSKK